MTSTGQILDTIKEWGKTAFTFITADKKAPWFLLVLSIFNIAVSAIAIDVLIKIKERSVQENNNYRYAWMILITNIVFGVIAALNIKFEF